MNLENLTEEEQYFARTAEQAGIPTSSEKIAQQFDEMAKNEGVVFANPSELSPFWRFVKSALVEPTNMLIAYLVRVIMPNQYIKTAKGEALDLLGWTITKRKQATATKGNITFTRSSIDTNVTIPMGTWINSTAIAGHVYRVKTTKEGHFDAGSLVVDVPVIAEQVGENYNLAEGYYSSLASPITGIVSVKNTADWITTPGTEKEHDDDYRLRIRSQSSTHSDYHVNSVYKNIVASYGGINYDRIYIDHTVAPRGAGSVDIQILFDAGVAVSDLINQINQHIRDKGFHGLGDDVLVRKIQETHHNLELTLYLKAGADSNEVKAVAEQIIRAAFRENQDYPDVLRVFPNGRFSMQKLGNSITQYVDLISIEWHTSDIVSTWNIPRLDNLTINIQEAI